VAVTRIDEFMSRIGAKGGMSLTTGFDVMFQFHENSKFAGMSLDEAKTVQMLCDEAQLPNVQSATGNVEGRILGEGSVPYPHTRIFTDVSLGFLCDARLTPLIFFQDWYDFIFNETATGAYLNEGLEGARGVGHPDEYRTNRLNYSQHYVADIKIVKTEPNADAANGRAPLMYILENAYPYAIDAVPLAYGTSQVTRVNVNFYYTRHSIHIGNDSIFKDKTLGMGDVPSSIAAGLS